MTRRQQAQAAVLDDLRDEDLDEQAPEMVVWEQRERENLCAWSHDWDAHDDELSEFSEPLSWVSWGCKHGRTDPCFVCDNEIRDASWLNSAGNDDTFWED